MPSNPPQAKDQLNREVKEKWQAQKSALTRDRIIIATLECIVEFGYESTTMAKIANAAKVSQGSMQYHFGSKIEAIKAAINYLHAKRLRDHQEAIEDVPRGADPMVHAVDLYWRQINDDYFTAYQDLVIAARTHPELASELQPAYQKFLVEWRRTSINTIPQWQFIADFDLISDLGQCLLEGLAFGRLNQQLDDARAEEVLALTKTLLVRLLKEHQSKNKDLI